MIAQIEIQKLPNQSFSVLLNGQECDIQLRQMGHRVYCSLSVEDTPIFKNALCTESAPINGDRALGFDGVLFFVDSKGNASPQWEGLGERWLLYYASSDEKVYGELLNVRSVH